MCSVAVKKQHCNSLKFAILEKEIKEKVKCFFKDCSFYAIWEKTLLCILKSSEKGGLIIFFWGGLTLIVLYSVKKN
jgi:hypothetical protein